MRITITIVFLLSAVFFTGTCCAGLGELTAIAKAQKDAQAEYAAETRAFEKVKAAICNGKIKKGQSDKDISGRYGEPVVNLVESETGRTKWIYKPAQSSFFSGAKLYLYFDKNNVLDEIKAIE